MDSNNGREYWRVRYLRKDRVGPCVVIVPADSASAARERVMRCPKSIGTFTAEPADTIEIMLARPLPGGIYPREALK